MKLIKLTVTIFIVLTFWQCTTKNEFSNLPNVVFILADDLGYGDVSCFNEKSKVKTPCIDSLAKEGVMFTDAHTSSSVCTPTRYGILTGRYNWRSRLKRGVLNGYSKPLIKPEITTIAQFLKEYGYYTACVGKWHLGWDWQLIENEDIDEESLNIKPKVDFSKSVKNGPEARGFDYSYVFCGSLDMPPYVWVENSMPTMQPTKDTESKGKQIWWRKGPTSDDFIHDQILPEVTEKTINIINERAKKNIPFFVYMPLPAPHTPILPTEEYKGKSGLQNIYADFVIMVDAMVGKVTDALEENGISENTIIVFTSDNGCSPQADFEQLATKGHDPSYVFRGHKADIFEGGHRVPLIVKWSKNVKPGISKQLVCTTDFFATVADIIGVKLADNQAVDSYSFLSALNIKSNFEKRNSIVHHSINGSFAYRKDEWKVIFCPGSGGWSEPRPGEEKLKKMPPLQVYNLKNDIEEKNNLFYENDSIVKQYREELNSIIHNGRSTTGSIQNNDATKNWPQLKWIEKK